MTPIDVRTLLDTGVRVRAVLVIAVDLEMEMVGDATLPELPAHVPDPAQGTGRGLLIIDALSSGWGITATEDTPAKTVWCELSAPAPVVASGQAPSLVPLEPANQAPGALAGPWCATRPDSASAFTRR